ncbi:hypothetical protein, conserved [Babesia ovata]|uniref:RRM domain-containing protein n=1 Tax=Babesia ovata TaxID=189622 RepID=A0A2H6KE50_9APIC|nr:uncharacterized protein BOVATA_027590 [Babesia ovata]GBE61266.1 hypothetical protein, conserved [Babesia ovata]
MSQVEGFDRASTVVLSGFRPEYTVDDCRAFASWFSPVIHVEQLPLVDGKMRFAVVFASTAHVEQLLKYKEISVENGVVEVSRPDESDTVWNSVGDMMTYATAVPIFQMAQDGLNVALNQLSLGWGGYLGN